MHSHAADVRRVWYDTIAPDTSIKDDTADGKFSLTAARGMILLAAVLCGTNFGAVKLLQDTMDAPLLLTARFLICAMCMSPFLQNLNPKVVAPAVQTGTLLGLGYLTQAIALQTTSAGVIASLCSLTTVTCPFIEKFTGGRVGKQGWAACGLAVLGAALLELGGSASPGTGDLWGLLQPVMFGLFFWKTEQTMRRFPDQALPFTTVQVFVCAALGAVWSVLDAGGMPDLGPLFAMTSSLSFDLSLLWLGLVSTAGVLVLQTLALGTMPSSETAVVFSSEPLWGVAFANMLLGESIGSNTVVGGSLIIAACIVRVLNFDQASLSSLSTLFEAFAAETATEPEKARRDRKSVV